MRRRRGFRRRSPDEHFEGVRKWLATDPEKDSMPAYNAWADEANATMADGERQYVTAHAIRTRTALGWANIARSPAVRRPWRRGNEEELAELLPPRSDGAIISLTAVARLLGISTQHAKDLADGNRHDGFPTAVATIEGDRVWLVKDIRAYKRGANFAARKEGGMQGRYVEAPELEQRLGMNHRTLWRCISQKRWDRVPQPEGFASKKKPYWRREKAEKWLADQG